MQAIIMAHFSAPCCLYEYPAIFYGQYLLHVDSEFHYYRLLAPSHFLCLQKKTTKLKEGCHRKDWKAIFEKGSRWIGSPKIYIIQGT